MPAATRNLAMSKPLLASEHKSPDPGCGPASTADWERKRALLRARLMKRRLPWLNKDELEAHFTGMPWRYWAGVNEEDLLLHLRTVHAFFQSLTAPETEGTAPVVSWRQIPERGVTEVLVCNWDRQGLLVKVAGAFATVRINIVQAVVYTRADNVVLDVFEVCDPERREIQDESLLHKMVCLLEAAVSQPPSVSFITGRHLEKQEPPASGQPAQAPSRPTIRFDNESSNDCAVLEIAMPDRLGLLYELLQVLTACGVNISQAIVSTEQGLARDRFHVTDAVSGAGLAPPRMGLIRARLAEAIGT